VHERVRVDAFERAGEGKRISDAAAASFGGRETKNRSQSLPPGEKAVAHRLVKRCWFAVCLRQVAVERAVDLQLPGPKVGFQIHSMSANRIDATC